MRKPSFHVHPYRYPNTVRLNKRRGILKVVNPSKQRGIQKLIVFTMIIPAQPVAQEAGKNRNKQIQVEYSDGAQLINK